MSRCSVSLRSRRVRRELPLSRSHQLSYSDEVGECPAYAHGRVRRVRWTSAGPLSGDPTPHPDASFAGVDNAQKVSVGALSTFRSIG